MQSNSDGLSPSLRAALGIGWNRSLPAPFQFDKGVQGDGVDDHFIVPAILGQSMPAKFTIEFWAKISMNSTKLFFIESSFGLISFFGDTSNMKLTTVNPANTTSSLSFGSLTIDASVRQHIVLSVDNGVASMYINGGDSAGGRTSTPIGSITFFDMSYLTKFAFLCGDDSIRGYAAYYSNNLLNEVRFYNTNLTETQASLNYNMGVGNNPCNTENLLMWFKFGGFETLDFSPPQDGSDFRLGIRDLSGRNNHAQPINMDTNPASGTYVLKPF